MGMKIHQRRVVGKIIVRGVNTKVRIGDGGTRHVQRVNNLLEVRGGAIRRDLIGKNGEEFDGERKAKRTGYLTKEINRSHDTRSNHMINKQTIRNQSNDNHRKIDRKPIKRRS